MARAEVPVSQTKILPCDCHVPFQDREYGPGLRVHNQMGSGTNAQKKEGRKGWRCTGCTKEKSV